MIPMGYLYRQVAVRPEWLKAEQVVDLYSLHDCASKNFVNFTKFWKHDGFWMFDSPGIMEELAREHGFVLAGLQLFYYESRMTLSQQM